jgi:hypothetical protein
VLAACVLAAAAVPSLAEATVRDARFGGTFVMHGVVTAAVNVRGERRGERVTRKWVLHSRDCDLSVCDRLLLTRNRGSVKGSFVILRRVGPAHYRGSGAFWVALECLGRRYRLGSYVPYTIDLHVVGLRQIGSIRYATAVRATYVNRSRGDNTRCPLGPASDAARYTGRLVSKLPKPPVKRKLPKPKPPVKRKPPKKRPPYPIKPVG